jgi:FtsP/CotA-like multicopper oxidase with cupredoxin domain
MHRRQLIHLAGLAAAAPFAHRWLAAEHAARRLMKIDPATLPRAPLRMAPIVHGPALTLRAQERIVEIAPGVKGRAWSPGDGPVGPTIEVRRGERLDIKLENALPEQTILHWHGLRVPEAADGHPRLAIDPGQHYDYTVPVIDRAGTYWYHSHAHHRTGIQAYRGMAGLLLVRDEHEEALGLPSGTHELPMLIQDRRLAEDGTFVYDPAMHEVMEGFFGDAAFVNGIRLPKHDVETTTYRLRLVNGTTSRILRLALSNGAPFQLIGTDGGLLTQAENVATIDLGTGERVDVLVDFSRTPVGHTVSLLSQAFENPVMGMMGMGGGMGGRGMGGGMGGRGMGGGPGRMGAGGIQQGGELTLVEFRVAKAVPPQRWRAPARLHNERVAEPRATRTRTFRFESMRMEHTINGRSFDMARMDETVRFGDTEVWQFVNPSPFPHPIHMHEVQFTVLERIGGRARIMPWERGPKDTVLVMPGEQVNVRATFDAYRGRFLMHCHNLVHEDMGMMLNFEVA